MNAYEFYLSTCKYVMLADPARKSSWVDLYSYLPCLRQMLSCCVCGNIMLKPKGPSHSICLHHVCSSCIGGKMRLRPACSWCRTHESFVENPGMRLLILCFKKMCEFINNTAIGQEIRKSAMNGTQTNTLIKILDEASSFEDDYVICNNKMPTCVPTYGMAPEPKLVSLPRGPTAQSSGGGRGKGIRVRSDSAASTVSLTGKDSGSSVIVTNVEPTSKSSEKDKSTTSIVTINGTVKANKFEDDLEKMPALMPPCSRGVEPQEKLSPPLPVPQRADVHEQQKTNRWLQSVHPRRGGRTRHPKVSFKRPSKTTSRIKSSQPLSATKPQPKLKNGLLAQQKLKIKGKYQRKKINIKHEIDFEPPCKRTRLASSLTNSDSLHLRKVCKCARLNPPSSLTCLGQRCPCYSNRLPCVECMCRGCRNPHKGPVVFHRKDEDAKDRWDGEHEADPPMPRLSPEPRT